MTAYRHIVGDCARCGFPISRKIPMDAPMRWNCPFCFARYAMVSERHKPLRHAEPRRALGNFSYIERHEQERP